MKMVRSWLLLFAALSTATAHAQVRPVFRARAAFNTDLAASAVTDPDVAAYEAAVVAAGGSPFTSTRRSLLSTMVAGLKSDGVWSKFDWFVICASPDSVAGRYNIKVPTKFLTATNSPTFTVDRGWAGDGSAAFLTTSDIPGAGGNYTQTSQAFGVYQNTNTLTTTGKWFIGQIAASSPLGLNSSTTAVSARLQNVSGYGSTYTTGGIGLFSASRTSDTSSTTYFNGSSIGTSSLTSVGITNSSIVMFRTGSTYSNTQAAAFFLGAGLSSTEMSAINSRLYAFLSAIGAN